MHFNQVLFKRFVVAGTEESILPTQFCREPCIAESLVHALETAMGWKPIRATLESGQTV